MSGAGGTISVVLPAFNAAATIAAAVASIRAQTDGAFELVVVDDGSTDDTAAVVASVAGKDPRVRLLRVPHGGIAGALSRGIGVSRGHLIARMDADDRSHPRRLELQRRYLEAHPEIGLVASTVELAGDREAARGYAHYVEWTNGLLTPEEISLNRFVESPLAHPSVMFRRRLVEELGGYRDGPFPEDYELWLRWLEAGVRMAKLPVPLLSWSDHPQRLSRTCPRYHSRAFYQIKAGYLARWLARHNLHHPRVVIWGAGRLTRKRAELLVPEGIQIAAYIDIDPRKVGKAIAGRRVLGASELPPAGECFVVSYVASRGAREDIRRRLTEVGCVHGRDFIAAA